MVELNKLTTTTKIFHPCTLSLDRGVDYILSTFSDDHKKVPTNI